MQETWGVTALIGEIMLGAALLMSLVGILTLGRAHSVIEWRSVFLAAGMLPLGAAVRGWDCLSVPFFLAIEKGQASCSPAPVLSLRGYRHLPPRLPY